MTGKEVAEKMLHDNGIYDVKVVSTNGMLTDHYNPSDKTVNLSESVYASRSVAAAAVAALKVDGGDSYSGWSVAIKPGVSVDVTKKLTFVAHAGGIGYFDTEDINNRKGFEAELSTEDLTFSLLWNF